MILLLHQASGEHASLLDLVAPYTAAYAERHGFAYAALYGRLSDRDPYWDKLAAIVDALGTGRYEGVVYMDADTLLARPEERLPLLVGRSGLGLCWHPHPEEPHWNVGVVHATPAALPLLKAAWDRYPVEHRWPEQTALNLEIQKANAEIACLDHSFNQTAWPGTQETWVQAWHGCGVVRERFAAMASYLSERRLPERVGRSPFR